MRRFAGRLVPALACLVAVAGEARAEGLFDTHLRPVRDGGTEVTAIAVRSVITGARVADGERFALTAPVVYANVPGIADRVKDLVVTDAEGVVPLAVEEDAPAPGGFPYYRRWRAERNVAFPLIVTYRAAVQPPSATRGPPFGIRPAAMGVSGAGSGFLILPANAETVRARVRWDLGDLAPGSLASSSFGDGDFTLEGPAAALWQGWYMAGPAGRFPAEGDVDGFSATWLGAPPWDPHVEMANAARIYRYLGTVFPYLDKPRYRVFTRILETPPHGGGTALTNSFMISRGPARPEEGDEGPQGLLFHELLHNFVGGIEGPAGITSWFSEGLTSYYTTLLQMRGGFVSIDDYAEEVNRIVEGYQTSPARNWSAARIAEVGFSDEQARRLVYRRGQLYFADLDARLRAASNGARDLDAVVRDLFIARAGGMRFDEAAWTALLARELGPEAVDHFRAVVIEGEATLAPASDAFGPCLVRGPATFEGGSGPVLGYRWERAEGVSEQACRPR